MATETSLPFIDNVNEQETKAIKLMIAQEAQKLQKTKTQSTDIPSQPILPTNSIDLQIYSQVGSLQYEHLNQSLQSLESYSPDIHHNNESTLTKIVQLESTLNEKLNIINVINIQRKQSQLQSIHKFNQLSSEKSALQQRIHRLKEILNKQENGYS